MALPGSQEIIQLLDNIPCNGEFHSLFDGNAGQSPANKIDWRSCMGHRAEAFMRCLACRITCQSAPRELPHSTCDCLWPIPSTRAPNRQSKSPKP